MTVRSAPKQRFAWPDVARGLSILGVVLLHVSLAVPEGMDTTLAYINRILDPLRMPLFFLVSGFFSAKVFNFSLMELFTRRLWFFFVPYVIWSPIELWLKFREYRMFDGSDMPGIGKYLENLLIGKGMYWFLFALILFNLVLWATRKLPTWAGILVGFLPILLLPLHSDFHMFGKAVLYLPAFLIGAHLRGHIKAFATEGASWRNLSFSSVLYTGAFLASAAWAYWNTTATISLPWPLPGAEAVGYAELRLVVNSLTQAAMIPMAIVVAILLARIPVISGLLKFLGRHTLVIYLGHALGLTVLYHYNMRQFDFPIERDAQLWVHSTSLWMVAAFVAATLGSLFMWVITQIPYLRWTIMPPALPTARTSTTASVSVKIEEELEEEPSEQAADSKARG